MIRELLPSIVSDLLAAHGIDPGTVDAYEVDAREDPVAVRLRLKPKLEVVEIEIVNAG